MWIKKTQKELDELNQKETKKSFWTIIANFFLAIAQFDTIDPKQDLFVCIEHDETVSSEEYNGNNGVCRCGNPYFHTDTLKWVEEK